MAKIIPNFAKSKFQLFYYSLTKGDKKALREFVGVSDNDFRSNYLRTCTEDSFNPSKPTSKRPKLELIKLIAKATKRRCTIQDIKDHFYTA